MIKEDFCPECRPKEVKMTKTAEQPTKTKLVRKKETTLTSDEVCRLVGMNIITQEQAKNLLFEEQ